MPPMPAPSGYQEKASGNTMIWLLVVAVLALRGSADDPDLLCYKECNRCNFHCTWRAVAAAGNATYFLKFCYHSTNGCKVFKAGSSNHYKIRYQDVHALPNLTAWVESHSRGRVERTRNVTLQLDNAIKLDPPPEKIPFSKSRGALKLRLPEPESWMVHHGPLRREARYRWMKGTEWAQVECQTSDEDDGQDTTAICNLETNAAFEVQIRHKTSHWSSYWSDWSKSIFVPAEILASPEVTYTVGTLRRNGQRNVTFYWQEALEEQGEVNYILTIHMLACGCKEPEEIFLERNVTMLSLVLSGAAYNISVSAANAAGKGPRQTYHIPPGNNTGLSFLDINSTGHSVTVKWAAKSNGAAYCFEKQPHDEPQLHEECVQKQFFKMDIFEDTGTVEPRKCYRIAIHGLGPEQDWSTFGSVYYFPTHTSLDGHIHIQNITVNSAFLQWKPSPLATCPGLLKRYIICCIREWDNQTTNYSAGSSARHYTLQDLQPGTSYRVGIQADTADGDGPCRPQYQFKTTKLDPNPTAWKLKFWYLGIFLGIPILATLYQFSKKRAKEALFPLLPHPMDSEAVRFPADEVNQAKLRPGFLEPSEKTSPTEALVTELISDKEEPDTNTETGSLQLYAVTEETRELLQAKAGHTSSENDLPFEYRRQVLLTPAEEEQEEDDCRKFADVCGQNNLAEAITGLSQPPADEGPAMAGPGVSRPPVQLSLMLSDKPVIIKNEESFDLVHDK